MKDQKKITLDKPIFKQLTDENKKLARIFLSLHNSIIEDKKLLDNLHEKELVDYIEKDIEKNLKTMEDIRIKTNLTKDDCFLLISELNGKQFY